MHVFDVNNHPVTGQAVYVCFALRSSVDLLGTIDTVRWLGPNANQEYQPLEYAISAMARAAILYRLMGMTKPDDIPFHVYTAAGLCRVIAPIGGENPWQHVFAHRQFMSLIRSPEAVT